MAIPQSQTKASLMNDYEKKQRVSCKANGADLGDWQSGDFHIIREYRKPIPR